MNKKQIENKKDYDKNYIELKKEYNFLIKNDMFIKQLNKRKKEKC